uniref:Cilia and flagella associated protein 46 n=1 Tax=Strix occidentalis caurina TaxID=311401 RepID=A0A8D0KYF1_STROC
VNQFLGRAYLCQGQLHTPLSTDNLVRNYESCIILSQFLRVFFPRYYFLIYNASVLYWQLVRPYLKPGFRYCLIPSLSQIVKALNQTEEQDNEWRAELMINLLECFLDASKLKEAREFSSTAAIFIKENVPDKYSQIFSLMEQGKLIEIECLECEYEIKKIGTKIVTYTKGVIEAQLELINNLELTLKRAVQLGDPDVIQVVCTTQWNLCLPLLQHSLHQHVRKPLISVADVLEEIDSMLILLRCQVHMEIARIEEDGDRIEVAVEHLQKAIHLNNSGQYQDHLRLTFNRLRLCTMLYKSPEHLEDQAVMMIEQAKRGKQKDNVRKRRSLLVNAGLALAPDSFQIVLDSENEAKVSSGRSRSQISYLCAKAEHHIKSVAEVDEHLKYLRNENDRERIILWADLAKVARKQEVWDVCRTACRFCLLYDDTLFRKKKIIPFPINDAFVYSHNNNLGKNFFSVFFQATVHLLRLQGVELNDHAVPPEDTSQYHPGYVSCLPESDPEWKTYSLWIDYLSQYAMENFQRGAEIGKELNEAWIVHNAVVYILNYNRHLISSGRQREIMDYLQTLLGAIKTVGSTTILLILCNALARGLILCWIPKPKLAEKKKKDAATDRIDPSGLPDIKAALEICEFALNVATGTIPNETVPIAAQQQIIATWVKAKQLHQQQIEQKLGTEEKNNDEAQNPMARILVGLEMYSCNGLGLMDFTVPSLSQLVKLALECSWSDSLVELQTLTRLAYFAYVSRDYEIVMTCSKRVLLALMNYLPLFRPGNRVRQEMLSTIACIQGKSIMENLSGRKNLRVAASKAFAQSARYAGEAGNYSLVMFAARHFWNACLPLLCSPRDREQFKEPAEIILKNIIKAESKNKQVRISNRYC